MSEYKIFLTDLDGTLLNDKKEISTATLNAINSLIDYDCYFGFSTGRSYKGVKRYIDMIKIPICLILYNGTMVLSSDNKLIQNSVLDKKAAKNICDLINKNKGSFCLYKNEQLFVNKLDNYTKNYKKIIGSDATIINNDNDEFDYENISKIIWFNDPIKHIQNMNSLLTDIKDCNFFTSNPSYLEFVNKEVDKGKAVLTIANYYSIKRENIITVGDGLNDTSMFEYSGISFAMKNANDMVKNKAQYVTQNDNNHDGIVEIIDRFIKEKGKSDKR